LEAIKDHCKAELDSVYEAQMAEAINIADLLSGQDKDKQA